MSVSQIVANKARITEGFGVMRKLDNRWFIELVDSDEGLEVDQPVKLLFWDARPEGARSVYEEIARVQQLELPIVVHGLQAQGALTRNREAFHARLKRDLEKRELE